MVLRERFTGAYAVGSKKMRNVVIPLGAEGDLPPPSPPGTLSAPPAFRSESETLVSGWIRLARR